MPFAKIEAIIFETTPIPVAVGLIIFAYTGSFREFIIGFLIGLAGSIALHFLTKGANS